MTSKNNATKNNFKIEEEEKIETGRRPQVFFEKEELFN
jgi:hypothetical protein